jgi:hypothetical protein
MYSNRVDKRNGYLFGSNFGKLLVHVQGFAGCVGPWIWRLCFSFGSAPVHFPVLITAGLSAAYAYMP